MARRHRHRWGQRLARGVGAALVLLAVLAAGIVVVVLVLVRSEPPKVTAERCVVQIDGTSWVLSPEQAGNAALLSSTAIRRGLPARAVTIAIATALQESRLINIDYGDRDSVGLFQQRPSQGWGAVEQIMDPVYSTNAFYDGLVKVQGYEQLPITEAAQAVQRSGFPDAYAQHEGRSRAWASALTGFSPGALTCTLREPSGPGSAPAFTARVERDYGALPASSSTGEDGITTVVLDTTPLAHGVTGDQERFAWAVAQWSVAVAAEQQVTRVSVDGETWSRDTGAWAPAGRVLPAGEVRVTLAGDA
ncbi:hypothetical protein [Cellulomonas chengniuliangii]|uniref:Uncharacterized protein n=1 Tax=Cellulomonas chengniuliangii TaxID=2968084 RepID=A0ABY5L0E7_9CELL|nr:hypothetical protein [Cellulomonas chengniuliangii]MCC2307038.1 hypothetical protein [Cellulomonas chengniuliangii]MCC2316421.1 hypothetical protein [Cellulomonas chengniuliangii]UUI76159.1 hypothetical protein NP064_04440 [Cellulomonas chengniuliangii]